MHCLSFSLLSCSPLSFPSGQFELDQVQFSKGCVKTFPGLRVMVLSAPLMEERTSLSTSLSESSFHIFVPTSTCCLCILFGKSKHQTCDSHNSVLTHCQNLKSCEKRQYLDEDWGFSHSLVTYCIKINSLLDSQVENFTLRTCVSFLVTEANKKNKKQIKNLLIELYYRYFVSL